MKKYELDDWGLSGESEKEYLDFNKNYKYKILLHSCTLNPNSGTNECFSIVVDGGLFYNYEKEIIFNQNDLVYLYLKNFEYIKFSFIINEIIDNKYHIQSWDNFLKI